LHQVGTSSLLIYMMHGHSYIKFVWGCFLFGVKGQLMCIQFQFLSVYFGSYLTLQGLHSATSSS